MNKNELKIGQWVEYKTEYKTEKGRIKSWNDKWVFVVYKCGENWDSFMDYTGCATDIKNIHMISDPRLEYRKG